MSSPYRIGELRGILKNLREAIQTLEVASMKDDRNVEVRERIKEARIQEAVILAKLAESGMK